MCQTLVAVVVKSRSYNVSNSSSSRKKSFLQSVKLVVVVVVEKSHSYNLSN